MDKIRSFTKKFQNPLYFSYMAPLMNGMKKLFVIINFKLVSVLHELHEGENLAFVFVFFFTSTTMNPNPLNNARNLGINIYV